MWRGDTKPLLFFVLGGPCPHLRHLNLSLQFNGFRVIPLITSTILNSGLPGAEVVGQKSVHAQSSCA